MTASKKKKDRFSLSGRVYVITGGGGLMGEQHARAIAEAGGIPIVWDIDLKRAKQVSDRVSKEFGVKSSAARVDITKTVAIKKGLAGILKKFGRVDGLVNNAANDPKVKGNNAALNRFENFSLSAWQKDIAVGLTGAFHCCQVIGSHMAKGKGGVIVNIASDLALVAPDQRLYRKAGVPENQQPTKPVTYSVVKHGLIGLTRYLATYWNPKVRVNAISPGGIYTGQPDAFVKKLTSLIPMGRMAKEDEYNASIVYLLSDASAYMTGSNLVIEGGRSCW